MFIALAFFFVCLHILYKLRQRHMDGLAQQYRYHLYELRDKLREHVMEGQIHKNYWVFDFLDSSITKACDSLDEWNVLRIALVVFTDRNDPRFERALEHLERELAKPENACLLEVQDEWVNIMYAYLGEKHRFLAGMTNIIVWLIEDLPRKLKKWIKELTASPETTTIGMFSPVYKTQ